MYTLVQSASRKPTSYSGIADPHPACHFDADPDPAFHFDADPDPAFHFDANPDPSFKINGSKPYQKVSHSIHFWLSSANLFVGSGSAIKVADQNPDPKYICKKAKIR